MKNIIFIAPPAAGKGTQSSTLKEKYNYEHISTGDLLRDAIAKQTPIGIKIESIMASGSLVSDEIVIELLSDKLKNLPNGKNFILDGFPRTIAQAQALDEMLNDLKKNDVLAIYLNIDEIAAMHRALGRLSCPNCKKGYNKYYEAMIPKEEGICDDCHTPLEQRSDDNEESFKNRFNTYLNNVAPILDYYKNKNILETIDANRDSKDVFIDIEKVLNKE